MNVRAHIFVEGRVQGVFFRYETRVEARKKSVKGWVRNLPDGRVEAIFEGEKGKVDEMINFCKSGPLGARVTRVEVVWEESSSDYQDFTIR
jgi:acylphosphatase